MRYFNSYFTFFVVLVAILVTGCEKDEPFRNNIDLDLFYGTWEERNGFNIEPGKENPLPGRFFRFNKNGTYVEFIEDINRNNHILSKGAFKITDYYTLEGDKFCRIDFHASNPFKSSSFIQGDKYIETLKSDEMVLQDICEEGENHITSYFCLNHLYVKTYDK